MSHLYLHSPLGTHSSLPIQSFSTFRNQNLPSLSSRNVGWILFPARTQSETFTTHKNTKSKQMKYPPIRPLFRSQFILLHTMTLSPKSLATHCLAHHAWWAAPWWTFVLCATLHPCYCSWVLSDLRLYHTDYAMSLLVPPLQVINAKYKK